MTLEQISFDSFCELQDQENPRLTEHFLDEQQSFNSTLRWIFAEGKIDKVSWNLFFSFPYVELETSRCLDFSKRQALIYVRISQMQNNIEQRICFECSASRQRCQKTLNLMRVESRSSFPSLYKYFVKREQARSRNSYPKSTKCFAWALKVEEILGDLEGVGVGFNKRFTIDTYQSYWGT